MDGQWFLPIAYAIFTGKNFPHVIGMAKRDYVYGARLSGAVGILTLRKSTNFRILLTGTLSIAIGAIVLFIAINLTNAVVLFLGSIITGVGFGTAFMGAIRSVMPLALPEERAGLMAAFFVESYLAFSIPAILAGYFVGKIGLMSTANSYISFIILLSLVALLMIIKNFKNK